MTRYLIIVIIILLSQSGFSQKVNFSRSIGTKAIGISAIFQNEAYGGELSFEKKISYQLNYCISLNYFQGTTKYSNFISYGFENKGIYEFLNLNDKLLLGAGLKLNMGIEEIDSKVEEKKISKFMIGTGLMVRVDLFISKRLSIFVSGSYNCNFKSEIYNNHYRINTGIKFLLL